MDFFVDTILPIVIAIKWCICNTSVTIAQTKPLKMETCDIEYIVLLSSVEVF